MARAWINPNDKGAGWTVYWLDPAKKQRQKTFRKKTDAESFRAKTERDLDTGVYIDAARGKATVVDLFERWVTVRGLENSSIRAYRGQLNQAVRPYFGTRTIGSIRLADIQAWISWMQDTKKYAPHTIHTRFSSLSSAFTWAVHNEEIGRNPALLAKLPGRRADVRRYAKKKIVVPMLDEVRALVEAFDPRYAAMVWLMAGCGLRVGEAMGVCRDQIDFRKMVLHVDRQITHDRETLSGKYHGVQLKRHTKHRDAESPGRTVPLPTVVADVLRVQLKKYGTFGTDQLLFPNTTRTGLLTYEHFRADFWLAALQRASSPFRKTHALRHFFASSMLSLGVPITDVAAWLGHSSTEVTYSYYGHLMPDAPERGRNAIDHVLVPMTDVKPSAPRNHADQPATP